MTRAFVLAVFTLGRALCAQPTPAEPAIVTREVFLGDSAVHIVTSVGAEGMADYLVLHDDENTAVDAGLEMVRRRGGRLVELRAHGERNVSFASGSRRYAVDPNRVFTEAGVATTLRRLSESPLDDLARSDARRLARVVIAAYFRPGTRAVVTLHNNTDGAYSAASYAAGGDLAGDAADVHLTAGADPDDFFFVTTRELFDALARRGFTVVLQDNERVTDDGSLSVWAGRRGLPYVNVEAQHGHLERQVEMLEVLGEVLVDELR